MDLPESILLEDLSVLTDFNSLPSDHYVSDKSNRAALRAILTIFPDTPDPAILDPSTWKLPEGSVDNWFGQFETCPSTGRLHAHIYVEFKRTRRVRLNTLRNAISERTGNTGDIQLPKRTSAKQRQGAINYVLKDDSYNDSVPKFVWEHNSLKVKGPQPLPEKKSKRETTVEKQITYIESKPVSWSWDQIVHESLESKLLLATCSWGAKYHAGRAIGSERRVITDVIVCYGAGGTGKTTFAQSYGQNATTFSPEVYYKRNCDDGKFWGGGRTAYRNQPVIHLEEFCGQETATKFKEICDIGKSGPPVNVKNGGTILNHQSVIITSNVHPAGWFKNLCTNDPKQWPPIVRRFTKVLFFPANLPDGRPNRPTSTDEVYYVDQTQTFNEFLLDDYNCAKNHASEHWPLPSDSVNLWVGDI
jgi:hypothetical protein